MDMNAVITYCENFCEWGVLNDLIDRNALNEAELSELFSMAGLSDDAAEFMAELYPGYACCALDNLRYTYDFDNGIRQFATEKELAEYLSDLGCSRVEYKERYGSIIEDAAFDGIVVTG